MIACNQCGAPMSAEDAFCRKCGAPAAAKGEARRCAGCGWLLPDGMIFCEKCGARYLEPPPAPVPKPASKQAPKSPAPAKKKYVRLRIFLFCFAVAALLLCFPAGIYGLMCLKYMVKAATEKEVGRYYFRGLMASCIGIIVGVFLLILVNGL